MPYPIKPYISIVAYKVIPTLISNAILMWPNTTWRYFKNAYKVYKLYSDQKKKFSRELYNILNLKLRIFYNYC